MKKIDSKNAQSLDIGNIVGPRIIQKIMDEIKEEARCKVTEHNPQEVWDQWDQWDNWDQGVEWTEVSAPLYKK